jgi:cellulose synthase/poly-beta-1,6-N-acetylglucosamine synthase-like glycosyltransferase
LWPSVDGEANVTSIIETLFWLSIATIAYAYILYPLVVWSLSRLFGRASRCEDMPADRLPFVSVLIAAHNEEEVIGDRIANAMALEYPADLREIVIASDGSSDATAAIARRFAGQGVRLLESPTRRGKAAMLNAAFPALRGEIVLLSDANTFIEPRALGKLVRWFADPRIGVVCGRLVLTDPATGRNVDGLYWQYETFLKRCEARLGGLLGANGAIYAVRRAFFTGIRRDTIVDDFVIPLKTRLRTGCKFIYDDEAVALEQSAPDLASEFKRRSRIGAGGFQSIVALRGLLWPREGWVAFTFLSHKVLRWVCPFALIGAFVANVFLAVDPPYRFLLVAQVAAYGIAALGQWVTGTGAVSRLLRLATMFATMNAALLVGFWRWLSSEQTGLWERTAR